MIKIDPIKNNPCKYDYLKDFHLFQGILILWILFIPLKNTLYEISIIGMIVMFAYHVTQFKTYKSLVLILTYSKTLFMGLYIVMICMLLSSLLGIDTSNNLVDLLKFFYRFVLILFILLYFYQQQFFSRKFLVAVLIATLTLYALDGFYQYFATYDLLFNKTIEGGGLTGPTLSRNVFGLIVAIYATILFHAIWTHPAKKYFYLEQSILLSLFLLSLFLLFHSLSRASWLAFATFISLYILANAKQIFLSKKSILFLGLIGVSIFTIFYFNPLLIDRSQTLLHGNDAGRFEIWKETLTLIQQSLWFGYGINSSLVLLKNTVANRVHNMPLEIALYLGIFGLISYIFLLGTVYKIIYGIKRYYYAFFLTAYLVSLQFDGSLVNSKLHLSYFILLLFLILTHTLDEKFYTSKDL